MAEEVPKITGPGHYRVDVAGESFYRDSLIEICGPHRDDGVNIDVRAKLVLQDDNPHDKKAVKVMVNGLQVGHLSRDDARAFRRAVRYGKLSEYETFECAALIRGGWDRGPSDRGDYGVRLDLPQDDD
ncbi:HIRAN domain-containing protein [Massilia varians]|uniref:HIRAN domain-containing protein n=1 Tax=Massilia varians TaxID=457921 RepID=UPI002553FC48|nr:HIRAN domain-containing protein [Massilia varians]MDK6079679.1 HIRAN domain-containing protein [Massilia varians]